MDIFTRVFISGTHQHSQDTNMQIKIADMENDWRNGTSRDRGRRRSFEWTRDQQCGTLYLMDIHEITNWWNGRSRDTVSSWRTWSRDSAQMATFRDGGRGGCLEFATRLLPEGLVNVDTINFFLKKKVGCVGRCVSWTGISRHSIPVFSFKLLARPLEGGRQMWKRYKTSGAAFSQKLIFDPHQVPPVGPVS